MDTNTLRLNTLEGIDQALNHPMFLAFITADQVRLLKAHRDMWVNATTDDLNKLLTSYSKTM